MNTIKTLLAALTLAFAAGCATTQMASGPARAESGALVGPSGMTLYTFDKDAAAAGKSVFNGECATNWPPLAAGADAKAGGDYSVITRDDGSRQWAYKGKPLYYWAKDQKPGDRTGDGVKGVWRVAAP